MESSIDLFTLYEVTASFFHASVMNLHTQLYVHLEMQSVVRPTRQICGACLVPGEWRKKTNLLDPQLQRLTVKWIGKPWHMQRSENNF